MDQSNFYTFRGYEILEREQNMLTPSMEDYMEMIYRVCREHGFVRMNQLADRLHVRTSSSTKIVQKLSALGLVEYEKYGLIELSTKGRILGECLLHRHHVIEEFLCFIGSKDNLLKDTELIEHHVGTKLLQNLESYNAFINQNPEIQKRYERYREDKSE